MKSNSYIDTQAERMNVICNIQHMQKIIYGEQFSYEKFIGNSLDELRTLQEQIIKEYNQFIKAKEKFYIKAKQVFSYVGLSETLNIYARIVEELSEDWKDADMKAICKRDAEILKDAANKVKEPLTTTL